MYRGITFSPVLSKLFEMVLLHLFEASLTSDDLPVQFGFKKKSSCSHALFAFNESVEYFTSNRTKVYAAFLYAIKACDKAGASTAGGWGGCIPPSFWPGGSNASHPPLAAVAIGFNDLHL